MGGRGASSGRKLPKMRFVLDIQTFASKKGVSSKAFIRTSTGRNFYFSEHSKESMSKRGISVQTAASVLNSPSYVSSIYYDSQQRPCKNYVNAKFTVVVNPYTGSIVTGFRNTKWQKKALKKK